MRQQPEPGTAAERLAGAADEARTAEARGDDHAANEAWRRYRLIEDAMRDPDELLAEGGGPQPDGPEPRGRRRVTDFGRLLADLNEAEIRYIVIGGIAVIRHGVVRATADLDIVVARSDIDRLRALIERWQATRPDGSPLVAGEGGAASRGRHARADLLPRRPRRSEAPRGTRAGPGRPRRASGRARGAARQQEVTSPPS